MKRTISLVAMIAMVLLIASCAGGRTKTGESKMAGESPKELVALNKAAFLSKVANYEENPQQWKYLGDKPAVIMFTADWCKYCKVLEPVLKELAGKYGDKVYFYKVDTDKESEVAGVFQVQGLPTTLFIPLDGEPVSATGALPKEMLEEAINEELLGESVSAIKE